MIITITCNPAIDKTVYEDKTVFDVGGKGINVSKVLNNLGVESIVTGFVGKENKDLIIDELNELGIQNKLIEINGKVRTNTKKIINKELIEENEIGPNVNGDDINNLLSFLETLENDIVVLSGSAPKNVNDDFYANIIKLLKKKNNYVIVDCAGRLLRKAIEAKPDFIKPNKEEICDYLNIEYDEENVISKCKELGIDLICVSLSQDGAIFISSDVYKCKPLKINVSSSVGAGDSMVAALAYSKLNNYDLEKTMKLIISTAAAACETQGTKPPTKENMFKRMNEVIIEKCEL